MTVARGKPMPEKAPTAPPRGKTTKPAATEDPPFDGGAPAKKPVFKFPKTLGGCADRLYELKDKMAAAQRVVDALDAERKALKEHVINTLPKSEATGVAGRVARVRVVPKSTPQVKDWAAFYAYVQKNKRPDLLQRRVNETAVKELLDAKKKVAGVEVFNYVDISLTKV